MLLNCLGGNLSAQCTRPQNELKHPWSIAKWGSRQRFKDATHCWMRLNVKSIAEVALRFRFVHVRVHSLTLNIVLTDGVFIVLHYWTLIHSTASYITETTYFYWHNIIDFCKIIFKPYSIISNGALCTLEFTLAELLKGIVVLASYLTKYISMSWKST